MVRARALDVVACETLVRTAAGRTGACMSHILEVRKIYLIYVLDASEGGVCSRGMLLLSTTASDLILPIP